MSSIYGEKVKISIFGESHGEAIGAVIDGLESGYFIDFDEIASQMKRRAPGYNNLSTARKEPDEVEVLSGIKNGFTIGSPVVGIIRNKNVHSSDYADMCNVMRPGHADYTLRMKYGDFTDLRGGGPLSGRLTAPMTFAGAVCRQILYKKGVKVIAHAYSIGDVCDDAFDSVDVNFELMDRLRNEFFPVISSKKKDKMKELIQSVKKDGDSIGGVIECAIVGVSAGIGDPVFGGVENKISSAMFAIPGLKGIEFGSGFLSSQMRGSENNDEFIVKNRIVSTVSNHSGGILGGISSGMPIIFRVAIKPTPSIAKLQKSVNLETLENTTIQVIGRHDPCIVPRAIPVVEALASIAILDMMR